ncbi:transcription factor bHLH162 [Vigna radiata var. radiata]|uniref:Transcription factor bHLH162 n=1 Tax=Vigna radiata var. radiata TaxID=3916 RepID=A0A1S3TD53_VIGRR|nr:transcription factor bHLH162 [Vigna radiata var. radiata]
MKNLYSELNSLLPSYNPKQVVAVPDQIDEATEYIKRLEEKVKMAKEKKERLMESKRSGSGFETRGSEKPPKMEIHVRGSVLKVILTCGLDNHFVFCEVIRILREENVEVISSSYTIFGDSVIHVVLGEVGQSMIHSGASKVSEKLKWFLNGSICNEEVEPGMLWGSEIGATLPWVLRDPTPHNALQPNPQ